MTRIPTISRTSLTILISLLALVVLTAAGCSDDSSSAYWAYQIQDHTTDESLEALAASPYEVLVIDQQRSLKGDEFYDDAAVVDLLKQSAADEGRERTVLAYLDVGEAESYRWYWQEDWEVGNPEWIVAPDPDGWDENYPAAFWYDEWRDIMFNSVDGLIADGYDGAYLDWLEVYDFEPVAEMAKAQGLDPEDELVSFVRALSDYAHAQDPEFILVAQNAAELGARAEYRDIFDAVAQEAVWFDGGGDPDDEEQVGDVAQDPELTQEYLDYLAVWQDAGVPVWVCEYATQADNVESAYGLADEHGFLGYVTTRPLDQLTDTPPP